jgi:hypothetical protein
MFNEVGECRDWVGERYLSGSQIPELIGIRFDSAIIYLGKTIWFLVCVMITCSQGLTSKFS